MLPHHHGPRRIGHGGFRRTVDDGPGIGHRHSVHNELKLVNDEVLMFGPSARGFGGRFLTLVDELWPGHPNNTAIGDSALFKFLFAE
jgi:hypothetical protein